MQTRCPYCETHFKVVEELVQELDARVRCGQCHTVFNARDQLLAEQYPAAQEIHLPQDTAAKLTVSDHSDIRSSRFDFDRSEDIGVALDDTQRIDERILGDIAASEDELLDNELPAAMSTANLQGDIFAGEVDSGEPDKDEGSDDEQAFDLLAAASPPKNTQRQYRYWLAGSLLLAVLIAVQWLYANRMELLAAPSVRPALQLACRIVGCELTPLRDLGKIELLRRSVYSHPNIDKALIISLAMVNNAHYAQAFPVLRIRMADVRGQIVAQRDFQPADYLEITVGGDTVNISSKMAPGVAVTVTLEIHDPGNDALTFELEFH